MNIILLSGGSGKRLWPLSNDIRSKQFLKLFPDSKGGYESMIQRMYGQILSLYPNAKITIATSKSQISTLYHQLGHDIHISPEPCRLDTFPAIVLASAYLAHKMGVQGQEPVVVCPVDPYVETDYFSALMELSRGVKDFRTNLMLMGITPTYPSEKYGYILPLSKDHFSPVFHFCEKPDFSLAQTYISQGALWNSGVFAFRLQYILDLAHHYLDFTDYQDLYEKYTLLPKISFDYAVAEKEKNIYVMDFHGPWMDLGTWNTLTEAMSDTCIGKGCIGRDCQNVHIVNETGLPVLAMGLKNVVISASPDGILVSDKHQSSYIKPYVDSMDSQVMYAEKSWGSFRILDVEDESLTIKITLSPSHHLNYHSHQNRDEVWVVISGSGYTIVDGMKQLIKVGDVVTMQAGCRHTVVAKTQLQLIEIQLGKEIHVQDKQKYDLEYETSSLFASARGEGLPMGRQSSTG